MPAKHFFKLIPRHEISVTKFASKARCSPKLYTSQVQLLNVVDLNTYLRSSCIGKTFVASRDACLKCHCEKLNEEDDSKSSLIHPEF